MVNIETKVVHSASKNAWNIIGTRWGGKYKIARIPYIYLEQNAPFYERKKQEALEHAQFISDAFNKAYEES